MKKTTLLIAAILAGSSLTVQAKSPKRGVSENEFQYKAQMAALVPGVSWFYNWANTIGRYLENEETLEYVPMCWNGNYSLDNIRAFIERHPNVKYILGFNEPNFKAQANMTPAQAAEHWPEIQAFAKEMGLKLVAPALNYSPDAPYNSPTRWMDEFVQIVGSDAFDFTAVHSYGGPQVTKDLCTTFHERYGKPVWLTEFCLWPNEGSPNSYVSPENQTSAMMDMVEWLEKSDFVFRYAWFKSIGKSDSTTGPNYGLLMSGKGEDPRELSQQGIVYVYMPDFDEEKYHAINTIVSAADYWTQTGCVMDRTQDPSNPLPIEISRFNAGATADYRFDVPQSGSYTLQLSVSGMGEPTRFDPNIKVLAVNADGTDGETLAETGTFTLPNDLSVYNDINISVTIPAGEQTIRIADANPYQPSGIRIATLSLTDGSGVRMTGAAGGTHTIYTIDGRIVKPQSDLNPTQGLDKGIYIIDGRKVAIR